MAVELNASRRGILMIAIGLQIIGVRGTVNALIARDQANERKGSSKLLHELATVLGTISYIWG